MRSNLIFVIALILICTAIFEHGMEPEHFDQDLLFVESRSERRSITFIMGEDKGEDGFYTHAAKHFATDDNEGTDMVVKTCHSLESVITYLNKSEARGQEPWSVVNIVAHGNPQTGLGINITENGHRATPRRLVQALLTTSLPRLAEGITDSTTRINFWSCGIGKSMMTSLSLKRLFTPASGEIPGIYCSPHFVIFQPSPVTGNPVRLKASYWPYYYKRGYKPGNIEIANALKQKYPKVNIDWRNALEKEGSNDRICTNEYHIPVSYTRIYDAADERPELDSEAEKVNWALSQEAITRQIEDTGIPEEQFHWTVNKIKHRLEDGTTVPAVKAIGMATVLYVLETSTQNPKA